MRAWNVEMQQIHIFAENIDVKHEKVLAIWFTI